MQKLLGQYRATGAQAAQLIKDGEVDMIAIYSARVAPVVNEGASVAFTYQDGLLGNGCLAILKGAARKNEAQRVIAGIISPDVQARIPAMMGYYGAVNAPENNSSGRSEQSLSIMSSANLGKQVPIQDEWWLNNMRSVWGPFKSLIGK